MAVSAEFVTLCTEGMLDDLKERVCTLRRMGRNVQSIINKPSCCGQTCLIAACRTGFLDVVMYLVDECGADLEQAGTVFFDGETIEGVSPLWCAAAANFIEIVRFLVARGANVNRTTITSSTALRAACYDGHEEVVRFLIDHGANFETSNRHEHTCLMIACFRGRENVAKYLLSKGARVNRRSSKGNTAVHDCAESGNLNCLKLLLQHGAVMCRDEYGQSPIMAAAHSGFKRVVDFLCQLKKPGTGEFLVPIEEQAASRELLGAALFDRQSVVQDAIMEWHRAMELRECHFGYTKRLPPPTYSHIGEVARRCHYAWRLIEDAARCAVATETTKRRRPQILKSRLRSQQSLPPPPPLPSAIASDPVWSAKYSRQASQLAENYAQLLATLTRSRSAGSCAAFNSSSSSSTFVNWRVDEQNTYDPTLASAVDAVLGMEPDICASSSRHKRRRLEGMPGDVTRPLPLIRSIPGPERRQPFFSLPQHPASRNAMEPYEEDAQEKADADNKEPLLIRRLRRLSFAAFGHVREFANPVELHEVSQDAYALALQPLLIRLRILGPDHPDTAYFLRYRGATHADNGAMTQCLGFWRYAVQLQRVFLEPLCFIAQSAFLGFAELFNVILSNRYSGLRAVHLQPRLILDCIDAIIDNIERGMDYSYEVWNKRKPWSYSTADKEATNFHRQIRACLHFISLTIFYFCSPKAEPPPQLHSARVAALRREVYRSEARPPFSGAYPTVQMDDAGPLSIFIPSRSEHAEMRAMMTPRLLDRFYRQVNRLVRLNPLVRDGQTLVHLACSSTKVVRCDLFPLPHADLIRLLCYLGADPDAIDANGYRPIGTILASRSLQDNVKAEIIATLVRDCGAHYDASVMPPTWLQSSREGDTDSADVKALRWPWGAACQTVVSLSGVRPAALVTLKCLAAHALPPAARTCPTLFPEALLTFVRLHHNLA